MDLSPIITIGMVRVASRAAAAPTSVDDATTSTPALTSSTAKGGNRPALRPRALRKSTTTF